MVLPLAAVPEPASVALLAGWVSTWSAPALDTSPVELLAQEAVRTDA